MTDAPTAGSPCGSLMSSDTPLGIGSPGAPTHTVSDRAPIGVTVRTPGPAGSPAHAIKTRARKGAREGGRIRRQFPLERAFPADDRREREEKNLYVHQQRPLLDVFPIQPNDLLEIDDGVAAAHLPETRNARFATDP